MRWMSGMLMLGGLLLALSSTQALAQVSMGDSFGGGGKEEIPSLTDDCINDLASLLAEVDRKKILGLCEKAQAETIHMVVVTIQSLDDYDPRPINHDRFADSLFEEWDTGYAEQQEAILLYVSKKDNQFRIVLGEAYDKGQRKKANEILRGPLAASFRNRKPSQGIAQAFGRLFEEVAKSRVRARKQATK